MTGTAATELSNPFPGLRPFREDEAHLFFGRESQIDRLVDKLAQSRLLAVVGTSGSGKSSLVNCGLRPALHRGLMASAGTSWRIAQFRPGSDPIRSMARSLANDSGLFSSQAAPGMPVDEIVLATLQMSKLGLVDVFEQAQLTGANLLVVVDQFEELFRYRSIAAEAGSGIDAARSQESVAFVNLLLEAGAQRVLPIYVVLTMRSDFLGDCSEFAGLAEAINEGQYLVPRMTRDDRRSAIVGPVRVGQGSISPVLLTQLVNDVGDNPDQLSILQHALNRTWARWQHSDKSPEGLTLSHYETIGTMARALDQHADKAYGELTTDRQKKICEKVFKAITDKGTDARGIRRPTRLGALCALAGATEDEVIAVLNVFRKPSRSFLMPPIPEKLDAQAVIDISHESLMRVWQRLKTWTVEEQQCAQLYRRLAETAALHDAGKASLWRERELELAETWYTEQQPTAAWAERYLTGFESAVKFLKASKERRDKERLEEEEDRKRKAEHETMLALAEEQKLRLAVEQKSAQRLRVFSAVLIVVLALGVGAGAIALYQQTVVTKQKKQIEDSAVPTKDAARTVSDISTQLTAYNDRLKQLESETTDPRLKSTIRELSGDVQTWQTSAGDADKSLRKTLLKQEQVVSAAAPASIVAEGWIFLGRVKDNKKEWAEESKTIRSASPNPPPGTVLTIYDDVYLRGDVPSGAYQSSGPVLSVVKTGETVEVLQINSNMPAKAGGNFVWAKVRRR